VVTLLLSLVTRQRKTDAELRGLVYSLTPKIKEQGVVWWQRPAVLGSLVLVLAVLLNAIFW
jgi:SSS family solute:Na+ symporter